MEQVAFGALVVDQDPRDYPLHKLGADVVVPAIYRPDYSNVPVYMQGKQPACGAHGGSTLNIITQKENGDYSPRFLWSEIKKIDGYPLEVGTDLYSVLKTLKDIGTCDFNLVGNDVNLSLSEYAQVSSTPEIYSNASAKKIDSFATTFNPTFDQIKKSIYLNGAIALLFRCGDNMYKDANGNTSWKEADILPLSPDRFPMTSGHFVVAIGFDEKYIYFRNSWSKEWGANGDGYFGADYVKYVNAIGSAVDKSKIDFSFKFTKMLKYGQTSTEVTALQRVLKTLGFFPAEQKVTGYYGDTTADAVHKFQLAQKVDSIDNINTLQGKMSQVGPKTRAALNKAQGI